MKKIHYVLVPLLLTGLGFFINDECSGVICFYPGRGFPLAFYRNQVFHTDTLLLDFALLVILWFICFKLYRFFKNKYFI